MQMLLYLEVAYTRHAANVAEVQFAAEIVVSLTGAASYTFNAHGLVGADASLRQRVRGDCWWL